MPKRTRINVEVSEHQYQVLMDLGGFQGSSASGLVRGLIDAAMPMFEAAVAPMKTAAELVQKQPEEARRILDEAFALPEEGTGTQPTLLQLIGHSTGHRRAGVDGADGQDRSSPASEDRTARTTRTGKRRK